MTGLTTHVLDTMHGRPAAGVAVRLSRGGQTIVQTTTNSDGRCDAPLLDATAIQAGAYPAPANMSDAADSDSTLFLERTTAGNLARNLAAEFGPKGVRVNCIAPGLVKTDFARALWENPDTLKAVTRGTPLRRIGEPHEIAGAAVYLASPASTFMTGQAMIVDGGSTIGVGL